MLTGSRRCVVLLRAHLLSSGLTFIQSTEPFKDRIVGFVSDRASNASGARNIMIKDIAPAALNLGDCCHHLHNTLKDIGKMDEFVWVRCTLPVRLS